MNKSVDCFVANAPRNDNEKKTIPAILETINLNRTQHSEKK